MKTKLDESLLIEVTEEIELTDEELELWQKQIDIADNERINQLISLKITSEQKNALEEICKQFNISMQDYLYKIFIKEVLKDYNLTNQSNKENIAI